MNFNQSCWVIVQDVKNQSIGMRMKGSVKATVVVIERLDVITSEGRDKMSKLGKNMSDGESVIPFGRFKGHRIGEVPDSYLIWLSESDWFEKKFPDLQERVNEELAFREDQGLQID